MTFPLPPFKTFPAIAWCIALAGLNCALLGRAKDRQYEPATTYRGLGFGLKWVPLQSDTGWSAGGRLDWGRTRVRDDATPARWTEREFALTALATFRLANGQALHLNAGRKVVKA